MGAGSDFSSAEFMHELAQGREQICRLGRDLSYNVTVGLGASCEVDSR